MTDNTPADAAWLREIGVVRLIVGTVIFTGTSDPKIPGRSTGDLIRSDYWCCGVAFDWDPWQAFRTDQR